MIIEFIVHTFGSSGGQKKISCCSSFKIQHHFTEKSFRNSTGIDHSTHRTLAILSYHHRPDPCHRTDIPTQSDIKIEPPAIIKESSIVKRVKIKKNWNGKF